MALGPDQIQRYARHLTLPEIGPAGQERLRVASVLCIGAGGLGSPAALYLAAAGIGRLGIVDADRVDISNLQRQILHRTEDIGRLKVASARATLRSINPDVEVSVHESRISSANALELIRPYDVILDGSDNFPTRYVVNDACVFLRKTNIYGAVFRFEGQASVFAPHRDAPCYRCLYPEPPPPGTVPSCAEGGVLGVVPGIIGTIQATETLKVILEAGSPLLGRLLLFNALDMSFRELRVRRDPGCPVCGSQPTITRLVDYAQTCSAIPDSTSPAHQDDEVTVQDMKRALDNPALGIRVLDVREPYERELSCVAGTEPFPLSALADRFRELDPSRSYYLHCKVGVRSLQALRFLRDQGFAQLKSVQGGILAWSDEIDPAVPKI
jgi:adenylyltransferase/sulfurtransferase